MKIKKIIIREGIILLGVILFAFFFGAFFNEINNRLPGAGAFPNDPLQVMVKSTSRIELIKVSEIAFLVLVYPIILVFRFLMWLTPDKLRQWFSWRR